MESTENQGQVSSAPVLGTRVRKLGSEKYSQKTDQEMNEINRSAIDEIKKILIGFTQFQAGSILVWVQEELEMQKEGVLDQLTVLP